MAKNLVIVESPAKAKTINKFIGSDFVVKASVGHVRDLPKSALGVDEETFEPTYEVLEGKEKVVSELKAAAKKADTIYIASDPDREGEAIGWHVMSLLGGDSRKVRRVLFHEITKNAVRKAMDNPTAIDMNKVNAQQARRVLDRLVGYKLSPLLWDKVRRGLSAGRVQSVAMKMIVDREEDIKAFVPVEYWSFAAKLAAGNPPPFIAKLTKIEGKKAEVGNEEQARTIEATLKSGPYVVETVTSKEKKQSAPPPLITSTLQRAAYNRFKYPVKRTMQIAQKLYEGKELGSFGHVGLITYMRTDSVRISDDALTEVRSYITAKYGPDIVPDKPNVYRVKKGAQAQEAHEAIRPTTLDYDPEAIKDHLTREEYNLYRLIWDRFVGSQMKPALFDVTDVDVQNGPYTLRASGEVLKFPGFLAVFHDAGADDDEEKHDDKALPAVSEGETLSLLDLDTKQNFTQPPPRYTEATLVKALEENGIGRPSTYGQILTTIQARDYTYKHDGKFHPTQLGMLVTKLLITSFGDIIDEGYTADLEGKLDEVEDGKLEWKQLMSDFSGKFNKDLLRAGKEMVEVKRAGVETDEKCETCGAPMVIKFGRFGEFLAEARSLELHRLPRLQEHQGSPPAGGQHPQRAPAPLRDLRQGDGPEERPLRSVLLLLRLSRLPQHPQDRRRQVHSAQAHRREVPDLRRRRAARAPLPPRHLLLLLPLPEVRLRAQQPPRPPPLPQVRRAVPDGEGDQARGTRRAVQQRRVRVPRADRPYARNCRTAGVINA